MADNHYLTLGIGPEASQEQIKAAYRAKAKQLHPDYCGGGGGPFRDVQEAYEVLSDPVRRRQYDDQLARASSHGYADRQPRSGRVRSRPCPAEPLVPSHCSPATRGMRFSCAQPFDLGESSVSSWLDSSVARRENLHFQITLTRDQVLRGGRVQLQIPALARCRACRGRGWAGFFECADCRGRGVVSTEYALVVSVPAGISDGATGTVSLAGLGLGDTRLALHFRVRGRWVSG